MVILFGVLVLMLFYKVKKVRYCLITILLGTSLYFGFHYFGAVNDTITSARKSNILFWNASRNEPLTTPFLMDHIAQFKPEIIALVEAANVTEEDLKVFKNHFPDYQFKILEGEMLIAVKGSIDNVLYQSNSNDCNINYIKARIRDKQLSIMISDVIAVPVSNRDNALNAIYQYTQKHSVDVLVGDFNTPYESVFFKPFKTNFKSLHPYSLGITYTWPLPYPFLEIDHIWLDPQYNPIKLQKFSSSLSRHKMLMAEYQ